MFLFGKKRETPLATDTELPSENDELSALQEAEYRITKEAQGIKILGSDTVLCFSLKEAVDEVLVQLSPNESAELISDPYITAAYGVIHTPALVVDGRVVCTGRLPSKKEIASFIKKMR
ncbi:thioredoxin family protein [Treponema sp. HNW]|uniref:thioredoxin family protein n=1 Tax=Treponema sp. HNW TaxID=3116654 RepID=UPI003D0DA331